MAKKSDIEKMDKSHFSIASLHDPSDEKEYWLSKTPKERLQALELMRQIAYGYDPSTEMIQRVFLIVKLK